MSKWQTNADRFFLIDSFPVHALHAQFASLPKFSSETSNNILVGKGSVVIHKRTKFGLNRTFR